MASKVKCGVYVIEQTGCQKYYIGSSKSIRSRWHQHRVLLRLGKHHSSYLQNAWAKYGEESFEFWVIEECSKDELLIKEQEYIDTLNPVFNVCPKAGSREGSKYTPEQLEKARIIHSARAALITHCPHGHEYTEDNMMTRKGKKVRICLVCNALHVKAAIAAETPEQRERRKQRAAAGYAASTEEQLMRRKEYTAAHAAEKYAYDVSRRALAYEQKRQRRLEMTPEQRAQLREQKRQSYLRHQETARAYNASHRQQKNADRNKKRAEMTPEQHAQHLELKRQSYARHREESLVRKRARYEQLALDPPVRTHPTHCPAGHLYDEENLRLDKYGFRHCRTCAKIHSHEKRLTRTPEQHAKLLEQKRRYYHQDGDKNRVEMRERYHKKKAAMSP